MSVWQTLSKIDVSKYVEKKNGFTYLSWAWAWSVLKDNYPDAEYIKHTYNGLPMMIDHNGYAYVQVTVKAGGEQASEIYPVLNHANKPIQNPDSFEVNKSLQRCLAKAIAALGLGAYIYQGEDLPVSNTAATAAPSNFKQAQSPVSLEQQIALAPDIEALKDLYNRVSLKLTPEQRTLFSNRKQEILGNG
jgi:hypothetical protein